MDNEEKLERLKEQLTAAELEFWLACQADGSDPEETLKQIAEEEGVEYVPGRFTLEHKESNE